MPRNFVDAILRQQQQTLATTQLRSMQRGRVVLGGSSGSGGGSGGPPGGFVGKLTQSRVCYDTTEAASSLGSTSLLDNLNHIRFDHLHLPVTSTMSSYVLTDTDEYLLVDASSGSIQVTLPTTSGSLSGKVYTIKHTSGSYSVEVIGTGGDTIDDETTQTLILHDALKMVSNGSSWHVV